MAKGTITTFQEDRGTDLPSWQKSREDMLPNVPAAKKTLKEYDAEDLAEMIFGEDA